jgi:hypothetical protein
VASRSSMPLEDGKASTDRYEGIDDTFVHWYIPARGPIV